MDKLWEKFGISEGDCGDARLYLDQEIRAFGRPQTWTLPQQFNSDGDPLFEEFAAVKYAPQAPDPMFFAAVARNDATVRVSTDTLEPQRPGLVDLVYNPAGPFVQNASDFSDTVLSLASEALQGEGGLDVGLEQTVDSSLSILTRSIVEDVPGRMYVCRDENDNIEVRVLGFDEHAQLLVVRGEAGLECAVQNSVAGAPCRFAGSGSDLVAFALDQDWDEAASGSSGYARGARPLAGSAASNFDERLYLVGPKPGLLGQALAPGDYIALAAGVVPESGGECVVAPVAPSLSSQAGRILTPSTDWCSHPAMECDGSLFDERIPLEDELSEDNDGIETSWKHYLTLAKQASEQADLLAREYIQAGLELDTREESIELREQANEVAAVHEMQAVQRICGTSVDPADLLRALRQDAGNDFTSLESEPICPDTNPCTCATRDASCPEDHICHAGACLVPPALTVWSRRNLDPEMAKLYRCLRPSGMYDAVTPGDTNLCYWRDPEDGNIICPQADPCEQDEFGSCINQRCPVAAGQNGCAGLTDPFGQPMVSTDATLGYYALGGAQGAVSPSVLGEVCNLIRDLREHPAPDAAEQVRNVDGARDLFHPLNIQEYAPLISFAAKPGMYFDLKLGGTPWRSNGSLTSESPNLWPCVEEEQYGCDAHPNALFCQSACAESFLARMTPTHRVRHAVLALRALSPHLSITDGEGVATSKDEYAFAFRGIEAPLRNVTPGDTAWDVASSRVVHLLGNDTPVTLETLTSGDEDDRRLHVRWTAADESADLWGFDGNYSSILRVGEPSVVDIHDPDQWSRENAWANLSRSGVQLAAGGSSSPYRHDLVAGHLAGDPASATVTIDIENGFWNDTGIESVSLDREAVLDAAELYCEARRAMSGGVVRTCDRNQLGSLQIESVEDLKHVSNYMLCIAEDAQNSVARSLLLNFPKDAADALRQASVLGTYPGLGGEMGQAVTALRETLIQLYSAGPLIGSQLSQLGFDIDRLRLALERKDLQLDLNEAVSDQQRWAQIGACSIAVAEAYDRLASPSLNVGGATVAAVCVNSAIQSSFISSIESIQQELIENESDLSLVEIRRSFEQRATTLGQIVADLSSAQERLDGALAHINNLRSQANQGLKDALWLHSRQAGQQFNINSAQRRRFNTERVRYEEAHNYAKRMAFLARRAIEARLGLRLESLDQTLPLVEAPSTWASSICATSPIDYAAVRQELDDPDDDVQDYADSFIGDYVRNLEAVVESYRLVNNFHEGSDIAVVSLRDDVFETRSSCRVPANNLLAQSGYLTALAWGTTGCDVEVGGHPRNCIGVELTEETVPGSGANTMTPGYLFTFGPTPLPNGDAVACDSDCDLGPESRWQQLVRLDGRSEYVLSWYAKQVVNGGGADASNPTGEASVRVYGPDGAALSGMSESPEVLADGWVRYAVRFTTADVTGDYSVGVVAQGADGGAPHQVLIAGIMLEAASGVPLPGEFQATDEQARILSQSCEDSEGREFRFTRWEPGCVLLCDSGFGGDCPESLTREHCYQEASFAVTQRDLEEGRLFGQSGFALGNFNYRIENMVLNFVGTDIRDCSDSQLPQSCYSSGFVPYSVIHRGPYEVRNRDGDVFEVPLFTGNIEHARGLATERYITNPISEADKSLLADYTRYEFQGRPLDGNFIIRVWEDEGFDFNQIQDVQLILNYRYWTRFD